MKKYLKLLLLCLLSPLVTNAATLSLDCPATAKAGTDITCTIKVNSDEIVGGVEASVSASTGLTYKSYTKTEGWDGSSSARAFLVYGKNASGDLTLGTYTYTVANTATGNLTVTFSNITIGDEDGKAITSNTTASKTIRVQSNDNTLSNLTISGATIEFSKDVTTYNVEIDSPSVTISATATNSYARITGTGTKTLNYGANKFDIVVTSELGTTKTYTINVTRPDNRSTDNTLKELKISNGTIDFKSGTTTYNLTIDATSTVIEATANNAKSTVKGTGTKTLKYGVNKFEIVVTAENGSTKTYTLNITRPDHRSKNTYLSSLTLSKGTINFDKNKTYYEITVEDTVSQVNISGTVEDSKSKVEGLGTKKLVVGKNTFTIKVTAENGSTKEYKVVVIRKEKEVVTVNNNIKNLSVTGHQLNFNVNTKDYVIETDQKTLNIKVELENTESTYRIVGNENLQDGSIIQIIVTDKEGNNNIYSLHIKNTIINDSSENEDNDKQNNNIMTMGKTVLIVVLSFIIIVLIALITMQIIKNKKRNY